MYKIFTDHARKQNDKGDMSPKKDEKKSASERAALKTPQKVPMPLASLVTATQGSTKLKTQVDMTGMVFRGDVVRIWKCADGYADWSISSDPQAPFDATTLTLSKPYVHKLRVDPIHGDSGAAHGHGHAQAHGDGKSSQANSPKNSGVPAFARPRARGGAMVGSLHPPGISMGAGVKGVLATENNEEEEDGAMVEPGTEIPDLRMWIMSNPRSDKRPLWKKHYDDGFVPFVIDFAESDRFEENFAVRMSWGELETQIKDVHGDLSGLLHQQRLDYFEKVTPSKIIAEAYGVLCRWHPVAATVDNVKWAKFAREMKLFPAKSSSQVDLTFAKNVAGKKERYVDWWTEEGRARRHEAERGKAMPS